MYPFIATFIINFCTRTRHEQLLPARTHASPQHTYTHSHAVHLIIRLPALILSHNNQRMMRWEDLSLFVYQRSNKLSINFYYYFFFFFVSFLSPHLLQLLSRNDDDEPATWLFTLIFFSSLRIDTFAIFDYINSFESNHRWHLVHRSINRILKIRIQNERKFFWKKERRLWAAQRTMSRKWKRQSERKSQMQIPLFHVLKVQNRSFIIVYLVYVRALRLCVCVCLHAVINLMFLSYNSSCSLVHHFFPQQPFDAHEMDANKFLSSHRRRHHHPSPATMNMTNSTQW